MKPGQIWSRKNSKTGEVRGFRICTVSPTMGLDGPKNIREAITHVVLMQGVKDPQSWICAMIGPEGIPLRKDGTAATDCWHLVEDVP